MILKNALIYDENFEIQRADILVEGEYIIKIAKTIDGENIIDLENRTLLPGFIDIHIHGCNGGDMNDASEKSLGKMSSYLAKNGVTSFCPASMTLPFEEIQKSFEVVESYKGKECGAYIHGINMEGPYISDEKKGAQAGDHIRKPDFNEFRDLHEISSVKLVDMAPEVEGAFEFARAASEICTVSVAHTNASYYTTKNAFENGFTHATHLFNAMPPIYNRKPGAVTAVFDNERVTAELICDGYHLDPAIIRMAFKLLGEDRAVVVSDAMKAAGLKDGDYVLGGQTVYVRHGEARLSNGAIAASTTNMFTEFKNLLDYGIEFKIALKACTINPARVINKNIHTGSLSAGKMADIIAVDNDLNLDMVMVSGKIM
ncbi:MAG TPA: N-acetylglucosamine-6-phosphate deacetylase [Clostridia bacterium]|nr:N-acetylglucosamine-6-phosphate deacetylase [Clostridia bacterium]